jgi:hypothetical protein
MRNPFEARFCKNVPKKWAVFCLMLSAVTSQAADVLDGLVLGYSFDRVNENLVLDSSPSGISGIRSGHPVPPAPTLSLPGHGQAMSFSYDQKQFVYVADSDAIDVNQYTLAAWVRYLPKVHDERWEILEKAGAYWMNIRTDTRQLRSGGFYNGCDGQPGAKWIKFDSNAPIPEKTWTHVASTYDGATLKIYINGVLDNSKAVTGATCANKDVLAIGAKYKPSGPIYEAFLDGALDDLRIYKRALTAAEIIAIKDASLGAAP